MTADPGRRGPAWGRRRRGGLRQVKPIRLRRVGPAERIQMLTVGGRVLRVATRDGDPRRPPLLLCNGIGGRLRMLTPRRHRDPGHAARIAGELYGGSLREDPVLARELLGATARSGAARGYYYQLLCGIGWTSLPRLRKLRPPALILAGDDDPIIPLVNARIMHRLIPDSHLHVYHGGHLELGVGAERLAPVVEAFLDADLTAEGNRP